MARKTKTSTPVVPSYVDFEPSCEWQKEDGTETFIVHLPDFKKDQLRVLVNNLGVLKVTGERTGDGAHRRRFEKEIKIPQGCKINNIRAKFIKGRLHVVMRKTVPTAPQVQQKENHPLSTTKNTQKLEAEASVPNDEQLKAPRAGNGKMGTITTDDKPTNTKLWLGSTLAKLRVDKKVVANLGIAIVAMLAIGTYVAYKCGSDTYSYPSTP